MAVVGDIVVKLELNMEDFQKGISNAEKSLSNVGKKMSKVGKKMSAAVTVPLTGVAAATIKVGGDFEQSMKKVEAVSGASAKDMAILEETARSYGKTTKFSAGQVADAMGFLGMAGFKTNEILDSTGDMLNLASISGMDLASVADIASNMLSGLGLEASEAGRMADVMAKTMTNSNVDVGMLGESFKYVAPTAKDLGIGLEELSASIGLLGDAGIQGSMAGTALATGLTRLAAPPSEARKAMENLGLSFFDAQGKMKSMPDILAELEGGFAGMSDQQKIANLSAIFGQESMKAWSVLLGVGSDKVADYSEELRNSSGEAQKLADIMNDTLYGRLDSLKSALADVGISIYKDFEAPLKKILETCTEWVRKFGELDESTRRTIVITAGIAAIIPPIVIALGVFLSSLGTIIGTFGSTVSAVGRVVNAFNKMRTALNLAKLLPLVTSPVGLIILAIGGLIAIGILVWKNWETVKAKTIEIWNAIKDFLSKWGVTILSAIPIVGLVVMIVQHWDIIKEKTISIFTAIKDFLVTLFTSIWRLLPISYLVEFIIVNWETIKEATAIIFEMIVAIISAIFNKILSIIKPIVNSIVGFISKRWNAFKSATIAVLNVYKGIVVSIWNGIKSALMPIVTAIFNFVSKIWNKIKTTTTTIFNACKDVVSSIWNSIKSVISNVAGAIWSTVKEKFNKVKSAMTEPIEKAKETIRKAVEQIKSFFSNMKLKIPKPKVPKISVTKETKSFFGADIPYPKFSVDWNAKGNIFNGASILGGGQGVGEAGAEVVMPIQRKRYMKPYAAMVADLMSKNSDTKDATIVNQFNISEIVVREEADIKRIAEELEKIQKKEARARGVLAFA